MQDDKYDAEITTNELEKIFQQALERKEEVFKFNLANIGQVKRQEMGDDTSVLLYRFIRLLVFKDVLGGGFPSFSYYSGKRIGAKIPIRSMDEMVQFVDKLKLGRMEVLELSDNNLVVNLYESATCAGLPPLGRPICYFEAGMFSGITENIFKKRMTVKETKCWGLGDKYCQFQAVPVLNNTSNSAEKKAGTEPHPINKIIEEAAIEYSEENFQLLSTLAAHTIVALENTLLYERAKKLMIIDTMTNVYNFGYFQNRLKEEFGRAERHKSPLSIMLIDVDYFKKYNDTFGHPEGDALLIEICKLIKKNIRTIDILCRYGGDEFAIILPQIDETRIKPFAERIVDTIGAHKFIRNEEERKMTISLGVSNYPRNSLNIVDLVKNADTALYKAKNSGRNCYFIHS